MRFHGFFAAVMKRLPAAHLCDTRLSSGGFYSPNSKRLQPDTQQNVQLGRCFHMLNQDVLPKMCFSSFQLLEQTKVVEKH